MRTKIYILSSVLPLAAGAILVKDEFSNSSVTGFAGHWLFNLFLLGALWVYTIVLIIKGVRSYFKDMQAVVLLPAAVGALFLALIHIHQYYRIENDESPSWIQVQDGEKKEGHESLLFDFKKNGTLKISAAYKFSDKYYWGEYTREGDSIYMDIQTDLSLSNKAYYKRDTFRLSGDTTRFYVLGLSAAHP